MWREKWEISKQTSTKESLINYNLQDCEALQRVTLTITHLISKLVNSDQNDIVHVDKLKRENPYKFGKIKFSIPELNHINQAAYWNYQRNKVYVRSNQRLKQIRQRTFRAKTLPINKTVSLGKKPKQCSKCNETKIYKNGKLTRIIYDIKFGTASIKRWIVKYEFQRYRCSNCLSPFKRRFNLLPRSKYGTELRAYIVYQLVELKLSSRTIAQNITQIFSLNLNRVTVLMIRSDSAQQYKETYRNILEKITAGSLLHVDETQVNIRGKSGYVWALTNLEDVIYIYSNTREASAIRKAIQPFNGVLISDFYAAYDGFDCSQQKCLIHLIRDFNDALHGHPFNTEISDLFQEFSVMLKSMVETIDRFGLKKRFLKKHKVAVKSFFSKLSKADFESEIANKYKKRLLKNDKKLFTFLDYDGVPWNNNNAENAIKEFAWLRKSLEGTSSENGIKEYLTLLSIYTTCKFKGIIFLDFLRSGNKDIDAFINTKH